MQFDYPTTNEIATISPHKAAASILSHARKLPRHCDHSAAAAAEAAAAAALQWPSSSVCNHPTVPTDTSCARVISKQTQCFVIAC